MPENHVLAAESIPARLLYPSDEVRALLGGISETKLRRLTKSGELHARKIGVRIYVHRDDIKAYIDGLDAVSAV